MKNSPMTKALMLAAMAVGEHARTAVAADDLESAEAFAAILDMLAGMAEDRGSPLASVIEERRTNGRGHSHHVQSQFALAIAAQGMRLGMDRASALKSAAAATGRTQKGLQDLGVPADREAFEEWFKGPAALGPRAIIKKAMSDLSAQTGGPPSWHEFVEFAGTQAREAGARQSRAEAKEAAIRALFSHKALK